MKMELTVRNMCAHVDTLSRAFELSILYDPSLPRDIAAAMDLSELPPEIAMVANRIGIPLKSVMARPIDDITSYAVVVHEMGHHLAPNGRSKARRPKPGAHPREWYEFYAKKLVAEEAAWEWARYYIEQMFEWTVEMEMVKNLCFATYQEARRTGGRV